MKKPCYSGNDLPILGINKGDCYTTAINKINEHLGEAEEIDLSWLHEFEDDDSCEQPIPFCQECRKDPSLVYCGEGLPLIGVVQGDHYDTVFEKIEEYLANIPPPTIECEVTITNSVGDVLYEAQGTETVTIENSVVNIYNSNDELVEDVSVLAQGEVDIIIDDVIVEVVNSNGIILETFSIPIGSGVNTSVVGDSTVVLKDMAGNIIDFVTLPATENGELFAPNSELTIKNTDGTTITIETLLAGESNNYVVLDSEVLIQNKSTSPTWTHTITIPATENDTYTLPTQTINIYNDADGSLIHTESREYELINNFDVTIPPTPIDVDINGITVASGATSDVELNLIDQDSNPVPFTQVGDDLEVNIPVASGWYRPIEWLEQPTIADENVVWELMAVYVGDQNPYTNNLQASGGVTTEFYTDKDAPTPFYTAIANNNTLIDYNDCDPSTEFRGYRQCWVKSYPTNPSSDWGTVDFVQAHSVYGSYSSQILERIISCKTTHPSVSSNHRMGVGSSISNMLENIEYRNKMVNMNLYNYSYFTPLLKRVYFENPTTIEGAGSDCSNVFTMSGLQTFPDNLTLKSADAYQCFYSSNLGECHYDFSNTTTESYQAFYLTKANRIIGTNMGNVTQNVGDFTNNNLYYLELQGYTIGHALNGNAMRGEEVFTAWIDSLGTASGSQNITVSTLQYNSFGGIGSYVDNEIFNKGYTLLVV